MGCYHHPDREAVAPCSQCGKILCRECAQLYTPPFCADCASQGINELKREVLKLGCIGIIMAIAYLFVVYSNGGWHRPVYTLLCGVWVVCIPFGWNFITAHTPRTFIIMPVIGWAIYFVLKLIGGVFIGWIAAPWKIYKTIQTINAVKEREQIRFASEPLNLYKTMQITNIPGIFAQTQYGKNQQFHLYAECVKCGYIGDIPNECPKCGAWYKSYIHDKKIIQQIINRDTSE